MSDSFGGGFAQGLQGGISMVHSIQSIKREKELADQQDQEFAQKKQEWERQQDVLDKLKELHTKTFGPTPEEQGDAAASDAATAANSKLPDVPTGLAPPPQVNIPGVSVAPSQAPYAPGMAPPTPAAPSAPAPAPMGMTPQGAQSYQAQNAARADAVQNAEPPKTVSTMDKLKYANDAADIMLAHGTIAPSAYAQIVQGFQQFKDEGSVKAAQALNTGDKQVFLDMYNAHGDERLTPEMVSDPKKVPAVGPTGKPMPGQFTYETTITHPDGSKQTLNADEVLKSTQSLDSRIKQMAEVMNAEANTDRANAQRNWLANRGAALNDKGTSTMVTNEPVPRAITTDRQGNNWVLNSETGEMEQWGGGAAKVAPNKSVTVKHNSDGTDSYSDGSRSYVVAGKEENPHRFNPLKDAEPAVEDVRRTEDKDGNVIGEVKLGTIKGKPIPGRQPQQGVAGPSAKGAAPAGKPDPTTAQRDALAAVATGKITKAEANKRLQQNGIPPI